MISGRAAASRRRAVAMLLPLLAGGCAYFNGVYNAREAQRKADRIAAKGREADAASFYASAAMKAESVLARHGKSRWRGAALFIAGRGEAMSDQCPQAQSRLQEFLAMPDRSADEREKATVAVGRCQVRSGRFTDAIATLDPIVTGARDRDTRSAAALWAARAAIALGGTERAAGYLRAVGAGGAQWELATAALGGFEYSRAESLLVLRAKVGDYRDVLPGMLTDLWRAGRRSQVEEIVRRYDASRLRSSSKAQLHLTIADLQMAEGADSAARVHVIAAQRASVDTLLDREAAARLVLLQMAKAGSVADVRDALERGRNSAQGSVLFRRLDDDVLLLRVLQGRVDPTGASLFLAAEVARDSLRAKALAHDLFMTVTRNYSGSLVAPKAFVAAAAVRPESTESYLRRVRVTYPRSPVTLILNGEDPSSLPAYRQSDELLRSAWAQAVAALADSIARLRPASTGQVPTAPTTTTPRTTSTPP